MTLTQRIVSFAGLVGLVLTLLGLFTSQRNAELRALTTAVGVPLRAFTKEVLLDLAAALVTLALFLAGLPLLVDTLRTLHPLGPEGPLRAAFAIVWVLLLPPLVVWQLDLAWDAGAQRRRLRAERAV